MKQVKTIIVVLLVLLGAAAGVAKMMQVPQELQFFAGLGLNNFVVIAFGVVQFAGALLLAVPRTRLVGAIISDLAFTLSAVMIFLSGSIGFGLVALVPAILAGLIVFDEIRPKLQAQQQQQERPL